MDDDQGEQVSRKLLYDLHLLVQLTDVPSWMLSLIVGRREGFVSRMTVKLMPPFLVDLTDLISS